MILKNKGNRLNWFKYIFGSKNMTIDEVAEKCNLKRDTLYRKIAGYNTFHESDIDSLLKVLNMKYEDLFQEPQK